ncbi:MAG: hypothetical protein F2793_09450 [Actinobacteria bacterium]|uniref:Unannotated protein n=1 Tax=freshwater metagenome TaxID=449393 RepID=A0A6J7ERF2_9ZZZZ|nr:hypothetical protein [Actinomycetota bacterium]
MSDLGLQQEHFSRREIIGLVVMSVVRTLAMMLLIWWVLSLVPERPDASIVVPIIVVVVGVAGYGWFFAHQVKQVKVARHPIVRSVESLVLVATMFLAVFAAIYVMISTQDTSAFTEDLDHFNAYYFAVTVLATVGFGDITPVSTGARIACMIQMSLDIAFIAVAVKILGGTAQRAVKSRAVRKDTDQSAPDAG